MSNKVRVRFDGQKLRRKMEQATFRSLTHAGGAIRLTARRSIRRRKNPSRPGTPPHTQTGRLKRSLRYEVRDNLLRVGPVNEIAGKLWNLHEFGGRRRRKRIRGRRYQLGDFGPVRVRQAGVRTTFVRMRLQTIGQANRATRLAAEEAERRSAPATYPKRPFMGPALDLQRPRLPRFWAGSVNQ